MRFGRDGRFAIRACMAAWLVAGAAAVAAPAAGPPDATLLRWTGAADILSLDIHAQNSGLTNSVHTAIYEALVGYDSRTFRPEPQLASSWHMLSPTHIRFNLRSGARFSDGSPVTSDDVVFSIERARAAGSSFTVYTRGMAQVRATDDRTVDILLSVPNPVLLNQLTELRIMSRAWATRQGALLPMDLAAKHGRDSHRHALGSGPFAVQEWLPGQRLVLVRNSYFNGRAFSSNVHRVVYTPQPSAQARATALARGTADLVIDLPPRELAPLRRDPGVKVVDGIENRTILLGMDQHSDKLPGLAGNPLKDVRVRRALAQAIDVQSLGRDTLQGLAQITGALVPPQVNGWTADAHQRLPFAPDQARRLLSEAGLAQGFAVDFVCPGDRYMNDAAVCRAIAGMWGRIGVQARVRIMPFVRFLPTVRRHEAGIYLLGWGVPTFDALYALQSLAHTVGSDGDGSFNLGRFSDSQLDALIDRAKTEADPARRRQLLGEALLLHNDRVAHIPLYNQIIPWAMRRNVELPHRPDDRIDWRNIRLH